MDSRAFDVEEASLSVVLRARGFRCALEARRVERLEPLARLTGADADRPRVSLGEALGLPPVDTADAPEIVGVVLRGRAELLVAELVEAVRDLGGARFVALPALTRLTRPAFRGVYDLEGGLLPVLDVDGLLDVPGEDAGDEAGEGADGR